MISGIGAGGKVATTNELSYDQKAMLFFTEFKQEAKVGTPREEQFFSKAGASLPLLDNERSLEGVFEEVLQ